MTDIYLRSTDGDDADDGLTWALAKSTLVGAFAAASAGDTIYVSDNHAESQGVVMTLTSPGTAAAPVRVICVDDSAEPPTATATTATITTTTAADNIYFNGFAYFYGITLTAGSAAGPSTVLFNWTSTAPWWTKFEDCLLVLGGSGSGSKLKVGSTSSGADSQLLELVNTPISFGGVPNTIASRSPIIWTNTPSALPGSAPTVLFGSPGGTGNAGSVTMCGVGLSAMGSGKSLFTVSSSLIDYKIRIERCKLGASVQITTGSIPGQGGPQIDMVNCDSADTNYRYYKQRYQGEIFQETTIVRTGGASDGTTPVSRKMVSSSNTHEFYDALVSDPCVFWNDTTGSAQTATIETVTDNVTLQDDEAWIEVEYLGTSGFPISSWVSDRPTDVLATPADQTTSSVAWTTTGLTTPVKQKLSAAFTAQEKGLVMVRVHLAKPSVTMYFDPEANVT